MAEYNYLGAKALGDIVAYLRSGFKGTIAGTDLKRIHGSGIQRPETLHPDVCSVSRRRRFRICWPGDSLGRFPGERHRPVYLGDGGVRSIRQCR